jgi:hypothetical protein
VNHRVLSFSSILLLGLLVALAGCSSDDTSAPMGDDGGESSGIVRGAIDQAASGFEFASDDGDDSGMPAAGPLLIRGSNVNYDAENGALLVDLTVLNASEETLPEPVTLTFVSLLPDGVMLLESDNEETGPGASFTMEFANDDAMWTPGEESLPRTVGFVVAAGTSVGFVARIDAAMPAGGSIGGLVWHDLDGNGQLDTDEPGLPGVAVELTGAADETWLAISGDDGTYRVDGLPAGFYTVTRLPSDDLEATTPTEIQVVLVENEDGEVSDFLSADFGCAVVEMPDDTWQIGDCLHVKGDYVFADGALRADQVCWCDDDDDDDHDDDKDGDDDSCWFRIRGPVTALELEDGVMAVMGSTLVLTDDSDVELDLDDLDVDDRVHVEVMPRHDDDETWYEVCRLRTFEGAHDRVRGEISAITYDEDDEAIAVTVLGVTIDITDHDDCDDD